MADFRTRLLSHFLLRSPEGVARVDETRLIEALILFNVVTVESIRLREISALVSMFGAEGLCRLLESGALRFQVVPHTIMESSRAHEPRPSLDTYSFAYVTMASARDHIDTLLPGELAKLTHLDQKLLDRLDSAIRKAETDVPADIGTAALMTLHAALGEDRAVLRKALEVTGRAPLPAGASLRAEHIGRGFYEIDPPWMRHLSTSVRRGLIEQSVLAVGSLAIRIEKMRLHDSLVGFHPGDLPIVDEHLRFLEKRLDGGQQTQTFRRVLEITGLPTVQRKLATEFVDVEALMEVRAARETAEFRTWLWSAHAASDEEIRERISGFGLRIGRLMQTTAGKALRWIASTGIGAIPGVGAVAGAAAGAADTFLLEKVFPNSGVVTFLGGLYPRLFSREAPE